MTTLIEQNNPLHLLNMDIAPCDNVRKRRMSCREESLSKYVAFETESSTLLKERSISVALEADESALNLLLDSDQCKDLDTSKLSSLETITLTGTDFSFEKLAELSHLPNLKYLHLPDLKGKLERHIKEALKRTDFTTATILAQSDGTINMKATRGDSLLHLASGYDDMRALELCIEYKIDINAFNDEGETALINAVVDGKAEIVELLLKAGADRNIGYLDETFRTPSIMAYYKQRAPVMSALPLSEEERHRIALQELYLAFSIEDESLDSPPGSLWAFTHLSSISADPVMKEAFKNAANADRDVLEELKNSDTVILEAASSDHVIVLVVSKIEGQDVLAVCNRGYGNHDEAIQYFIIDRTKIDEDCLDTLQEYCLRSIEDPEVVNFLYVGLPELIASEDTSFEEDLEALQALRELKSQKTGNCTLASPKTAAAAIIAIQTYNTHSETLSLEEMQKIALTRYKKEIGVPLRMHFAARAVQSGASIPKESARVIEEKMKKHSLKYKSLEQSLASSHLTRPNNKFIHFLSYNNNLCFFKNRATIFC